MPLNGIHHISAITGDARRNLDFYTGVLGLRLVAKTVNQDDPGVYHLFYGSEHARPGADLTFFEYPRAIPGRPGAGMVHRIVSRVGSPDAIAFWAGRLGEAGVGVEPTPGGGLRFADPEHLDHELVVSDAPDLPLTAEHPEIPAELALQGFEGVRAYSHAPARSAQLLTELMGARAHPGERWELRGETRGGWIAFDPAPAERGRQSAGVVHHIAWGTTDAELPGWIERVREAAIASSGYVDRHFFHSLYFREPGGILYELATEEPGFAAQMPVEELGRDLILPPFLEGERERITARLEPLPDPRAGWPAPHPAS